MLSTLPAKREEILAEIAELEARLFVLREQLPSPVKAFYRFRVHPGKFCWVYASSREQSQERVIARMDADYPSDVPATRRWEIVSKVVDVIHDPVDAANQTSGSLLRSVSREQAIEFLADYKANQQGRVTDRPKELPSSTLERDIRAFEHQLKLEAA